MRKLLQLIISSLLAITLTDCVRTDTYYIPDTESYVRLVVKNGIGTVYFSKDDKFASINSVSYKVNVDGVYHHYIIFVNQDSIYAINRGDVIDIVSSDSTIYNVEIPDITVDQAIKRVDKDYPSYWEWCVRDSSFYRLPYIQFTITPDFRGIYVENPTNGSSSEYWRESI